MCLCPGCTQPSQSIHSYYRRHPMELPCTGCLVRIILSVKKFFCCNPECSRKVFTERISELIEPSSRLTTRLRTLIQAIGVAFNANGGARLATQMGIHVSRMTVLFSLHLLPLPPVGQVKRIGIDDFGATRKVARVAVRTHERRLLPGVLSPSSLSERTEQQSYQPLHESECSSSHRQVRRKNMRLLAEEGQRCRLQ